jgi:hypothetical protein
MALVTRTHWFRALTERVHFFRKAQLLRNSNALYWASQSGSFSQGSILSTSLQTSNGPYLKMYHSFISWSCCSLWRIGHPWNAVHFSFLILYTVGRTPWTSDQPVARPLPTQDNSNRINVDKHPHFEWGSKPRPQYSNGRRQSMP